MKRSPGAPPSREQQEMVRRLCGSGDGVDVVRAPAGSGKTYAREACKEAWQASGLPGVRRAECPGRRPAARRPESRRRRSPGWRLNIANDHALPRRGVLIVDDAGMVGTRTLARPTHHAHHADAKLVSVGDDRQLPEINGAAAKKTTFLAVLASVRL